MTTRKLLFSPSLSLYFAFTASPSFSFPTVSHAAFTPWMVSYFFFCPPPAFTTSIPWSLFYSFSVSSCLTPSHTTIFLPFLRLSSSHLSYYVILPFFGNLPLPDSFVYYQSHINFLFSISLFYLSLPFSFCFSFPLTVIHCHAFFPPFSLSSLFPFSPSFPFSLYLFYFLHFPSPTPAFLTLSLPFTFPSAFIPCFTLPSFLT